MPSELSFFNFDLLNNEPATEFRCCGGDDELAGSVDEIGLDNDDPAVAVVCVSLPKLILLLNLLVIV